MCDNSTPMPKEDASVAKKSGRFSLKCASSVASRICFFKTEKACCCSDPNLKDGSFYAIDLGVKLTGSNLE